MLPSVLYRDKSKRRPREEHDHYPTRAHWVIEEALRFVQGSPEWILDPGCGEGHWGEVAQLMWPRAHISGVDIRSVEKHPAYNAWWRNDFLTCAWCSEQRFDLVVGNFPYSLGEKFLRRGMDLLRAGGELACLMPLSFLCGQARGRGLYAEMKPADIAYCCKRPTFYGSGSGAQDFVVLRFVKGEDANPRTHWIGAGNG